MSALQRPFNDHNNYQKSDLIEERKNCGPTTTTTTTTTTAPTIETCLNTQDPDFCPEWNTCDPESETCVESPEDCPALPISWKKGKFVVLELKGNGFIKLIVLSGINFQFDNCL